MGENMKAKINLAMEVLETLVKLKEGGSDGGADEQHVNHTFFARIPSTRPGGGAVHLWLQSYPGSKHPSQAFQQKIATMLFDSTVKEGLCAPGDITVVFALFLGSTKLKAVQASHVDFAHPRFSQKALTRLWFKMIETPLLTPTRTFVVGVRRSKEEILHSHMRAVEPSSRLLKAMEMAKLSTTTKIRDLLVCTSNTPYGAEGATADQAETTHLFNLFMERFYATPGLVQTLLKLREDKLPAPQIVHCRIDEAILRENAPHSYIVLPMTESPVWCTLDLARMRGIKSHPLIMLLEIESKGRHLVTRTISLKDDVIPLEHFIPFVNYKITVAQQPGIRVCAKCDLTQKSMQVCSVCKTVRYCSSKCSQADWPVRHKAMCQEIKAWLSPDSPKQAAPELPLEVD